MRRKILGLVLLLTVVLVSVSAGAIAMTPPDADIEVTQIHYPKNLNIWDPVNISVEVENTGGGWGSPYVYLYINGVEFWSRYTDPIRPDGGVDIVEFPSSLTGLYMPSEDLRVTVKSGWLVEPSVISEVTHEYDFTINFQKIKPDFLIISVERQWSSRAYRYGWTNLAFSIINIGNQKATDVKAAIVELWWEGDVIVSYTHNQSIGDLPIDGIAMLKVRPEKMAESAWGRFDSSFWQLSITITIICNENSTREFTIKELIGHY